MDLFWFDEQMTAILKSDAIVNLAIDNLGTGNKSYKLTRDEEQFSIARMTPKIYDNDN